MPELMVARIGRQIVEGLLHLHSRRIIHRRLTPDTVLVTHAGDIKITDFEMAQLGESSAAADSAPPGAGAAPGEATYSAPEWLAGSEHGANVDIYSLGVIAVDLATGTLALDAAGGSKPGPPTLDPALHSASLCDFVGRCYWARDIRPSSRAMLMHPFVQQHTGLGDMRLADPSVPALTKEIVLEFLHHFYEHLSEALAGSEDDLAVRVPPPPPPSEAIPIKCCTGAVASGSLRGGQHRCRGRLRAPRPRQDLCSAASSRRSRVRGRGRPATLGAPQSAQLLCSLHGAPTCGRGSLRVFALL